MSYDGKSQSIEAAPMVSQRALHSVLFSFFVTAYAKISHAESEKPVNEAFFQSFYLLHLEEAHHTFKYHLIVVLKSFS